MLWVLVKVKYNSRMCALQTVEVFVEINTSRPVEVSKGFKEDLQFASFGLSLI